MPFSIIGSYSSLLTTTFDQFILNVVHRILPYSQPSSVEHQIIRIYLTIIFLTLITYTLSKSIVSKLISFNPSNSVDRSIQSLSLDLQRSIVDIYIDLNHFDPLQCHHSIESLLGQFRSIVRSSLRIPNDPHLKSIKLVYWCYIHRDSPELIDWIHQLDRLESEYHHGFVQVLDTSYSSIDHSSQTQKPLLRDLLKILNVSPVDRLQVISTADLDICTAGIDLIKLHPNSPILSYIPPLGSPIDISQSNLPDVDHLFRWDKDGNVAQIEEFKPRDRSPPPSEAKPHQKFQPLLLIFKALNQSSIDLETIKDYLKPWCSDPPYPSQSGNDPDQVIMKYIHSALTNGIISLSNDSNTDQTNRTSTIVHLQKPIPIHYPSHFQSSPSMSDKPEFDEDAWTTTGSDVERSEKSSPSKSNTRSSELQDPPRLLFEHPKGKDQNPSLASPTNLLKHNHPPPSLDIDLIADRPVKKKRNENLTASRGSPPSVVRSVSNHLRKRTSKRRNHPTMLIIGSQGLVHINLDHSSSLQLNHFNGLTSSPTIVNRIIDPSTRQGSLVSKPNQKEAYNDSGITPQHHRLINSKLDPVNSSSSSIRLHQTVSLVRSTLWVNCSSGITIINRDINHLRSITLGNRVNEMDVYARISTRRMCKKSNGLDLENCLSNEDEDPEDEDLKKNKEGLSKQKQKIKKKLNDSRLISIAHQHFKRLLIPAIVNLSSHSSITTLPSFDQNDNSEDQQDLEVVIVDRNNHLNLVQSFGLNDVD